MVFIQPLNPMPHISPFQISKNNRQPITDVDTMPSPKRCSDSKLENIIIEAIDYWTDKNDLDKAKKFSNMLDNRKPEDTYFPIIKEINKDMKNENPRVKKYFKSNLEKCGYEFFEEKTGRPKCIDKEDLMKKVEFSNLWIDGLDENEGLSPYLNKKGILAVVSHKTDKNEYLASLMVDGDGKNFMALLNNMEMGLVNSSMPTNSIKITKKIDLNNLENEIDPKNNLPIGMKEIIADTIRKDTQEKIRMVGADEDDTKIMMGVADLSVPMTRLWEKETAKEVLALGLLAYLLENNECE